jgi:hypothetical protein
VNIFGLQYQHYLQAKQNGKVVTRRQIVEQYPEICLHQNVLRISIHLKVVGVEKLIIYMLAIIPQV